MPNEKVIKWLEKKLNRDLALAKGFQLLGKETERWFYLERARTILGIMNEYRDEKQKLSAL